MIFMRIREYINVTQPLKRGKKLKVAGGSSATLEFKYERFAMFRFVCGKLGHTDQICDIVFLFG